MDGRPALVRVVLLAGLALAASGCQSEQMLRDENARLTTQNRELQSELNRERTARDSAENERARLAAEVGRGAGAEPPMAPGGTGGAAANTGAFAGIAGVEVEQQGGETHVRIPGDVLFDPGRAAVKPAAGRTLDQIAAVLNADYAGRGIRVEGYTDSDPIRQSHWQDNLQLSMERAAAVLRYLEGRGLDGRRMYAAGFGANHPRPTKAASRRVEIVIVP